MGRSRKCYRVSYLTCAKVAKAFFKRKFPFKENLALRCGPAHNPLTWDR